jgi:hypothetical protein
MPSPTRSFCIDPLVSPSQDPAVMGVMPYVDIAAGACESDSKGILQAFYDFTAFVMNWDGRADMGGG